MKEIVELFIEDRMWPDYIHENRRLIKNKMIETDFQQKLQNVKKKHEKKSLNKWRNMILSSINKSTSWFIS